MNPRERIALPRGWAVVACRVFQPELEYLLEPGSQVHYLEQGLHRTPDYLQRDLAALLAALEEDPRISTVVLVYGFCGGGMEGLTAQRVRLVVPLVHDCIPLLWGKRPEPKPGEPGAFYLSAGWIDYGETPFSEYRKTAEKFGEEEALWVGREMLKGYDRVVLLTSPLTREPRFRDIARTSAALFSKAFQEIPASLDWLASLLLGEPGPDCRVIEPGTPIRSSLFPTDAGLAQTA